MDLECYASQAFVFLGCTGSVFLFVFCFSFYGRCLFWGDLVDSKTLIYNGYLGTGMMVESVNSPFRRKKGVWPELLLISINNNQTYR